MEETHFRFYRFWITINVICKVLILFLFFRVSCKLEIILLHNILYQTQLEIFGLSFMITIVIVSLWWNLQTRYCKNGRKTYMVFSIIEFEFANNKKQQLQKQTTKYQPSRKRYEIISLLSMEYCGVRVRKYYSKIYDREVWIDPYNMLHNTWIGPYHMKNCNLKNIATLYHQMQYHTKYNANHICS
jgi:hypothetical protein